MAEIDVLFNAMLEKDGSDLHLEETQFPKIRQHGSLTVLDGFPRLTRQSMSRYLSEIAGETSWKEFQKTGDLDFAYAMGTKSRFRANYFRHFFGLGAIFRTIPTKILTLDQIDAPSVFKQFADLRSGMVLVTGPTGSGKSTTLAAIIDYINDNYKYKIVTIEEPVEFVHHNKKSLIVHREVGKDTRSFTSGLQGALKSDANVILVGEMRDRETIELALTAVEMGILVFGTLHTNSASKTIDRIIDVFPANKKNQIRSVLSNALKGVVSQQLLKSADGSRRWAAHEILLYTSALPGIIRSGESNKLDSLLQTNRAMGMIAMDDRLLELVSEGKVGKEAALEKALDKARFK
ncbi:MAG: type IV pili twitching motility protein PilT [Acidobacteria bacterium]|nr:MAG: type IV pili twitching motility protein PilT [Acidobacteriota bacterium]PIE89615.1 MAG: type IV pili twitching motility protein PilT [Acidobacteriota bacterium]